MSPRAVSGAILRETPILHTRDTVADGTRKVLDSGMPALPVVGDDGYAGVFGERELLGAVFPGYLKQLKYAGFVRRSLEEALEKRSECRTEAVGDHMNTEHVDVDPEFSDVQVAEIFLHHRVLIVPVVEEGTVVGVITRAEFFRSVAERLLSAP